MQPIILKGWRYGALVGTVVGAIALAMYPIAIYPYIHTDEYKKVQAKNREGIDQEAIQPGGMKVWSDPFNRPKKE